MSTIAEHQARGSLPTRLAAIDLGHEKWAFGGLLLILALQFSQVFRRAINWDEFWHYNHLHMFQAGTLTRPLNTLHTRAFSWVIDLPGSSVDHIVTIRLFMFAFEFAIIAAIVGLATRFSNRLVGLLCGLAYVSFPYVFQHGYSFRFDPPAAALMMSALYLIACRQLTSSVVLATGALIGIALLVTIKIVLLIPAFAGVIWLRWNEHGRSARYVLQIAWVTCTSLAVAALIFALHSKGIAGSALQNASEIVGGSGSLMFALEPKPYWQVVIFAALGGPAVAALILLFFVQIRKSGHSRDEKIALVGMLAPLSTLVFYHNAAPYFYVFMLPSVIAACCISMSWLTRRLAVSAIAAILSFLGVLTWMTEGTSPIDKQRKLLEVASKTFPDDTRYFDLMGFLATQPKANPFMTPANVRAYWSSGVPLYSEAMENAPVPLLIDNDLMFAELMETNEDVAAFMPRDAEALRETYVHFWGPFYLAGQQIPAGKEEHRFEIRVPGTYTLEGATIKIGGLPVEPGETIEFKRGSYRVEAPRSSDALLIWGDRIKRPTATPPERPHFTPF